MRSMPHDDPILQALCRGLTPWQQVVLIAGRQGRAIHVRQIRDCEITRAAADVALDRRLLNRVHRGVRAVGPPKLDRLGQNWAAHLAAGADTALARDSGAALSGLRPVPREVHVASPRYRRNHRAVEVHTLAGLNPAWIRRHDGLPVLRPSHLMLDLATDLRPEPLGIALNEALARRLVTVDQLGELIDGRPGHPGRGPLSAALAVVVDDPGSGRTHSELEDLVLRLLRPLDLPPFERNKLVELAGGRIAKADILVRDLGLMIELDSRRWHEQRRAMDSDRRRDQQALAVGLQTFRITWRHATREWPQVSADLLATVSQRIAERASHETAVIPAGS